MSFIYLVTGGDMGEELTSAVELSLWQTFGFEIRRKAQLEEPMFAFDKIRKQYNSIIMMRELLKQCPSDAVKMLTITENDIFIPMLSFIFGHAQLNGRVALVSTARLRQEFYRLPANRTLLMARTIKESIHEIGHTFGLIHCMNKTCPMSLSTTIQQVDTKTDELCDNCSVVVADHIHTLRNQSVLSSKCGE